MYAFAVALHEALYGVRPFAAVTVEELRWATAQSPQPKIGRAPDVPSALEPVLGRALSADPAARYPTMRALFDAVRVAVDGTPLFHLRAHAVTQLVAGVAHASIGTMALVKVAQRPSEPPGSSSAAGMPDGVLGVLSGLAVVFYVIATFGWLFLGSVWAPLNAFGLWKRKPWARISTMIYAVFACLACCTMPYGIWALWAMTRPRVRELFQEADKRR